MNQRPVQRRVLIRARRTLLASAQIAVPRNEGHTDCSPRLTLTAGRTVGDRAGLVRTYWR